MKNYFTILIATIFLFTNQILKSQDTFSICAVDTATGEVGSAGASCISGSIIISDIHPGRGVIHTQALWNPSNQDYARTLMNMGLSPQQIIDSLVAHDAQGDPTIRQYGIADLIGGGRSAAYTGVNCFDYKNHILGPTYSIQGNILLGQPILDSMEARFLRTPGTLADKLMAALQGAKVIGADTRCTGRNTSSISAFLRVARPQDTLGTYWINLNVNNTPVNLDPIDSLQALFNRLGPVFVHTPLPNTENLNGPYVVNSIITSPFGAIDPAKTKLYWTRDITFDSIPMTNTSGNNWTASIPGNGSSASYKYYLKSTDVTGVEQTLPYGAPDIHFSFNTFTNSSEVLLSPLNNSVNNPIPLNLHWRRVAGATNYLLKVSSDSLLNNLIVNDSTITDTIKNVSQVDTSTRYYWKVTAKDNSGAFLSSSVWSFTTGNTNLAQPTYSLVAKNFSIEDSLADDDMLKFDIYIEHTNYPAPFQYAGGQYFFSFNNGIATSNSDLQYSIIGSDLPSNVRPRNPAVGPASNPTANVLRLATNVFPGAGNGYIMTNNGFPGTKVVRMRLRRISGTFNTQYFNLLWRNQPAINQFTRITAYVGTNEMDVTTPSSHSIDSTLGVLPVELISFSSSVIRNNVTLNWSSMNEKNNSGFDIERSNGKGQTANEWDKIGFIDGNGSSNSYINYTYEDRNLSSGKYKYRLKQIDFNGNYKYFELGSEVDIGVPEKFELSQNYPNPFNPKTIINYQIPSNGKGQTSNVKLVIYDALGKEIAILVNAKQDAGYYSIEFDGSNFSSGIYFYRLKAGQYMDTKRMVLLK